MYEKLIIFYNHLVSILNFNEFFYIYIQLFYIYIHSKYDLNILKYGYDVKTLEHLFNVLKR